ncbi:sensor domain-containing protein [Billgrantia gudaonensis]|uniref:cyclic-guanylate-specific phosphodiesterase n=1 Tax=Billgrantia gudaonensis TaxID=376427 RepID=A0A1G8Y6D3_9GAMM|nr:EAL domain-containing protein [Halomonas gudaonensis]SDJ98197.1 PAS domain S-box-containing protein/diguanylate cyclase (GGDEF) domain-containing protein [Halomonas gudaonensis]
MEHSNRRLAIQAWLLILLTSSFLVGLSSLLLDLIAHLPLPPQWRLSPDGTLAVLLASFGLLALLRHKSRWRRIAGGLMVALGGYSLGYQLLIPITDAASSWLAGHPGLEPVPATLVLILGACCFLSPASDHTRRYYRMIGWVSSGIGAATLVYPLTTNMPPAPVVGLTSMGSVFCLLLGIGLLIMAHQRTYPTLSLPRSAVIAGIIGVTGSLLIWLTSNWMQYHARVAEADKLVNNIADGMEQRVEVRARLIERLAARWLTLGERPSRPIQQVEMRSLMNDEPSLQAIAYLGPESQTRWRVGRTPEDLLWLMDQLTDSATLGWLRQQNELRRRIHWRFPDPERSSHGLLSVTLDGGQNSMLAAIDFAEIVNMQRHLDTGGFTVTYSSHGRTWGTLSAKDWHEGTIPGPLASREVALPGGPMFTVSALDGPLSLTSLPGALPVTFGLLGLVFTYQLIISRALVAIRDAQASALQLSEQRFRSLFTQNPDAVFALDKNGNYRSFNPATESIVGFREREILGQHFHSVISAPACAQEDIKQTETAFRIASQGRPHTYSMCYTRKGMAPKHLEVLMLPIIVNGEVDGVFGIAKDITARVAAEERLRILERSLEASSNGAVILDVREDRKPVVYVNPAFTRITGYLEQEVIGHPPAFLAGDETDPRDIEQIHEAIRLGDSLSTTVRAYRRDGTAFWNQLFLSPVRDDQQRVTHFVSIMNDISERKEQESQLAYQATHDVLTGLGNRALFSDRLAHDVELAARNGQTLAVLFIDLDGFKPINDTLGHKVGDQLLISVSERLRQDLRTSDTLVRLGGDEFVLLLPDLNHASEAEEVAVRLLEELNKAHRVSGHELHVSASIGIAVNYSGLDEPERLLQHADMAMYKAKQQGRNTYQLYTEDLDNKLSRRVTLRSELQEAIEHGQLSLHYQPLLDRENRVVGLEALVRWHHHSKGFISPATFIPMAEETGQIIPLSRWVMRKACQDAQRLVTQGLLAGRMAINLSPLQFHRPNFLSTLRNVLDETGLAPTHLELELTEGILMHDTDGAIDILHALNGMEVSTSIDDFGTGFSSLSYLRDLPIDKIKIDRSFVKSAAKSDKNAAICQGVITLAQELDLRVVAEGIETAEQHDYLMSLGCEVFQGYLFARPMPLDSLSSWLAAPSS